LIQFVTEMATSSLRLPFLTCSIVYKLKTREEYIPRQMNYCDNDVEFVKPMIHYYEARDDVSIKGSDENTPRV